MNCKLPLIFLVAGLFARSGFSAAMDVAPFGLPLPEGNGVMWEDPREVHQAIVHFSGQAPAPEKLRLEYWGSRWPHQHLPKDRQPGGADVGWMELGNWYRGGWRVADAEAKAEESAIVFTFRPVSAKEFPAVKNYEATFRYTLKLRLTSEEPLPKIERIEAFTDSVWKPETARLEFGKAPGDAIQAEAFNGTVKRVEKVSSNSFRIHLQAASNPDPNTFDRTLVTVRNGKDVFTFGVDDLKQGALFLPHLGLAVLPETDKRDYAAVASDQKSRGAKTLYERVAEMPEQTWGRARGRAASQASLRGSCSRMGPRHRRSPRCHCGTKRVWQPKRCALMTTACSGWTRTCAVSSSRISRRRRKTGWSGPGPWPRVNREPWW